MAEITSEQNSVNAHSKSLVTLQNIASATISIATERDNEELLVLGQQLTTDLDNPESAVLQNLRRTTRDVAVCGALYPIGAAYSLGIAALGAYEISQGRPNSIPALLAYFEAITFAMAFTPIPTPGGIPGIVRFLYLGGRTIKYGIEDRGFQEIKNTDVKAILPAIASGFAKRCEGAKLEENIAKKGLKYIGAGFGVIGDLFSCLPKNTRTTLARFIPVLWSMNDFGLALAPVPGLITKEPNPLNKIIFSKNAMVLPAIIKRAKRQMREAKKAQNN